MKPTMSKQQESIPILMRTHSVKEETDAIKKDLNEMKTSVASDFTEIWKDFGNLKEDCESKAPRNFRNGYITGTKTTSTD